MTKIWCKIWNTFLMIFNTAIEGVGTVLKTVGTVFVDVLGSVLEAGSGVLGGLLKSPVGLLLLVGGGFFLLSYLGDDDSSSDGLSNSSLGSTNDSLTNNALN